MTVLVVGVPEGEELERLRSRIQSNPHFQVISHAREGAVALAHARVLLPDITVLALSGALAADPAALEVFRGVRALDPPAGSSCGPAPTPSSPNSTVWPTKGPYTSSARATPTA
ncbi:hypothetical protein ACQEVM_14830 [Streptomyces sp. CA-243310]|uniref:hypothetical protein n=1 Tax=Streptomyces sp. CA-243310 TaxID=3240056 RepID=UPI003D93F9FB